MSNNEYLYALLLPRLHAERLEVAERQRLAREAVQQSPDESAAPRRRSWFRRRAGPAVQDR